MSEHSMNEPGVLAQDATGGRRPVRARTVVFGLAALAVAVSVLLATLTDVRVNGGAVALAVLIGAGSVLLGAGVLAAVREANGGPGGPGTR